jgi:CRISPR-associated protein Csb2
VVIAPRAEVATSYRIAVPNNDLDAAAAAWARGAEPRKQQQPAALKTMKPIQPMRLREGNAVHYLWPLPASGLGSKQHVAELEKVARSVVALGWGVDLVVGNAVLIGDAAVESLPGERWTPGPGGSAPDGLRVPIPGTLDALTARERAFLSRLTADGFYRAPPPISVYAVRPYRPDRSPPSRSVAAFAILPLDASGFRAYDPARRALTVAGMVRHATRRAAEAAGWTKERIDALILGHSEARGAPHAPVGTRRLAFLPVPSVEWRGNGESVGSIRRVLVTSYADDLGVEIDWVRRCVSGQELIREQSQEPDAIVSLIPGNDRSLRRYLEPSAVWSTVTPVVLPGFDDPRHYRRRIARGVSAREQRELLDKLAARIEGLLRKAIVQSAFSEELARNAELEWREIGFLAGVEPAAKYGVPDHLARFPRTHVRIHWRDARGAEVRVSGPVCVGAGRYYGVGLCAAG